MRTLLKFGAIVTAIGFIMTALSGSRIINPDPGMVGADIGSGIGFGFGQMIGWIGVACVAISFIGLSVQAFSRDVNEHSPRLNPLRFP
ncbi:MULTISPECIES: hypothetical protein [Pseudonocardia]|uniref:Uncharacterized protein n=2 Tax=Pseudonocardia TaxID=1847 RepID=A0A1Y2MR41_PSEAH|nr:MULTISPECIES: hypothetical protein [Pseudonocardia]OSY36978.1 hypothetical protein BG845_05061 [Pseudonocardia autotrophica]TDN75661.1 hypothetical protein C8E95_4839 [Pseudonocardia autotrophica]BBF99633.1 hypothetical protein Pdca_08430 [Pseudonocardia autotrophica]GEC27695.1 hypothetical protein PSA01_47240 [Pseudonocardia saturnea]